MTREHFDQGFSAENTTKPAVASLILYPTLDPKVRAGAAGRASALPLFAPISDSLPDKNNNKNNR